MARSRVARTALLQCGLWAWALGVLCALGTVAPQAWAGGSQRAPKPCRAPEQWEGRQVLFQQSSGLNRRARLSYDGLQRRVRVLEERKALVPCKSCVPGECVPLNALTQNVEDCSLSTAPCLLFMVAEGCLQKIVPRDVFTLCNFNNHLLKFEGQDKSAYFPKLFEYILLFNDGIMFRIEQATKQCSKFTLTDPWDPLDIPENSTFEDQYSIGGPQEQITVQEWSDRKSARSYETWIGIYTLKDCYPVQEIFTKNYSVIFSTRFFDIELGIKDPSVFIPPSTCQAAQMEWASEDCL